MVFHSTIKPKVLDPNCFWCVKLKRYDYYYNFNKNLNHIYDDPKRSLLFSIMIFNFHTFFFIWWICLNFISNIFFCLFCSVVFSSFMRTFYQCDTVMVWSNDIFHFAKWMYPRRSTVIWSFWLLLWNMRIGFTQKVITLSTWISFFSFWNFIISLYKVGQDYNIQ